jgi:hypothetical protein
MAQEIDEGVPYLNALKQSESSLRTISAKVPATETGAELRFPNSGFADFGDRFKGTDRRLSPRYKCEGSAELSEEGAQVRTWATFADISLHGCYVEAKATYPVGTILRLKLEANGVRVETKGCVRVTYPYLGMGIALVEMSDENRVRLKELLGTITRSSMIIRPDIPSLLSASAPVQELAAIADPGAAVRALIEFFADRQVLMRDGFLRILRKSQETMR